MKSTHVSDVDIKSVAFDMSCFIHKSKYANNCSIIEDDKGTDFLYSLYGFVVNFLHLNAIYLVFDGKTPEHKLQEFNERRKGFEAKKEKAKLLMKSKNETERTRGRMLLIETLETRTLTQMVVDYFKNMPNIFLVFAEYEADAELANMSLSGKVDTIVTEDSDLIVYGCNSIIFKLKRTGECQYYNRSQCCVEYESSRFEFKCGIADFKGFVEFCVMCGCDYYKGIKNISSVTLLKKVKQNTFNKFIDDFGDDQYKKAVNVFKLEIKN